MARIRSIHQGFFTDEAIIELQPLARLFLLGLLTECDDQGVFEWKPKRLKVRLFPADAIDADALLAELVAVNVTRRFEVAGVAYGAIRNFRKWQRPQKPHAFFPLPDDLLAFVGLVSKMKHRRGGNQAHSSGSGPTGGGGHYDTGGHSDRPKYDNVPSENDHISRNEAPSSRGHSGNRTARTGGQYDNEALETGGQYANREAEGRKGRREEGKKVVSEEDKSSSAPAAPPPGPSEVLFHVWLPWLMERAARPRQGCASQIGKWRKLFGDDHELIRAFEACKSDGTPDPMSWMEGALRAHQARERDPTDKTARELQAEVEADDNVYDGVL